MCPPQASIRKHESIAVPTGLSACQGKCTAEQRRACPLVKMMESLDRAKAPAVLPPPVNTPFPPLRSYRNPRPRRRLQMRGGRLVAVRSGAQRVG